MMTRRALAAQPDGLAHRTTSVRRGLGLTQGAFGERLGITRNTVLCYERGQIPRAIILDRIAQLGGVRVGVALHGPASEQSSEPRRDQAWQEAIMLLRQVWQHPGRRGILVNVLKALRSSP
jgi:transcriptional regulator with XRE-family HTH domain